MIDFKTTITATISDVSCLRWFSSVERIYVDIYYFKERFHKMEIEIDSENKSQLKRIRKSPFLLIQEESLAEKVEKYHFLFDDNQKTYKERDISQKFSL